jgi:hypothetical protein
MTLTETLNHAIASRAVARGQLKDAQRARDLGKRMADEAQAQAKTQAQAAEAAEATHAKALQAWARSGGTGKAPTMADDDGAAKDDRAAARSVSVTAKALSTLQDAVTEASKVVEGAESAVRAAALNILKSEAEALAAEIEADEARLSKRERLAALDLALAERGLLASRSMTWEASSERFVGLWAAPALMRVSTTPSAAPLQHLELIGVNGPWRLRVLEAEKAYRERIAALIAGTPDQAAA